MKGYELSFMAPKMRRFQGKPVLDLIIALAKAQGITRFTRRADSESTGREGRTHAVHFFELADQPEELMFIIDEKRGTELLRAVEAAHIPVFLVRRAVEYTQFGQIDK